MFVLVLILHLLVCFSLILVVLLQSGKGGGLAGAFGGGGGSQALFGGRGAATFLGKATTILGAGFMLTSLTLALMSGAHRGPAGTPDSLMKRSQQQESPTPLLPSGDLPGAPSQTPPQGAGTGPSATPMTAPGTGTGPASSAPSGSTPGQGATQSPATGTSQSPAPPGGK